MRKMCRGSTKPRCSQQGNVFSQLRQQLQFHPRWHHCKPETSMRYQHQSVLTNNRRCTTQDSTLHSRVPRNMRSAPNPVQDPQDIFRQAKNKLGCHLVPLMSTVFNLNPTSATYWVQVVALELEVPSFPIHLVQPESRTWTLLKNPKTFRINSNTGLSVGHFFSHKELNSSNCWQSHFGRHELCCSLLTSNQGP